MDMKKYIKPETCIVLINIGDILETDVPVVGSYAINPMAKHHTVFFDDDYDSEESGNPVGSSGSLWDD